MHGLHKFRQTNTGTCAFLFIYLFFNTIPQEAVLTSGCRRSRKGWVMKVFQYRYSEVQYEQF